MASSRISRLQYFARWFFYSTVLCMAGIIGAATSTSAMMACFIILTPIYLIFSGFILPIQRLHDMNASGWWILLYFVPAINTIFALVLLFKSGTPRRNRFGPKPCITKLESWMIPISLILWLLALIVITFRSTLHLPY